MLGMGLVGTVIVILVVVWLVRRAWGKSLESIHSVTRVNDHSMKFAGKNGDKIILSGTIAISPAAKTRTLKARGMTAAGAKAEFTAVYDKD